MDRYYIERFLHQHRQDIRGHVLEIKDSRYTNQFGTGIVKRDVLDIDPNNPLATIVADLGYAHNVPSNVFNCFVLTQTLQFVFDVHAAIVHAHRILLPGGVLLATVPSIIRVERAYRQTDYWRFTQASCLRLFGDVFGAENISVESYGNVFSAVAFLMGLAHEELPQSDLDVHDAYFPVIVGVHAVKRPGADLPS